LIRSNEKLSKAPVKTNGKQARPSQNYLKAVAVPSSSDMRADTAAFQEKVDALARLAANLAVEIGNLQWLGQGIQPISMAEGVDFYEEVRHFEISLIVQALNVTGGSQRKGAALLRMNHTTLNTKIKAYRIECTALSISVGQ